MCQLFIKFTAKFLSANKTNLRSFSEMAAQFVTLNIQKGCIRGQRIQTLYGDSYFTFEGIPYGKPPMGELRFKAPQPVDSWAGILDCLNSNIKAMQMNRDGVIEGTEDCLYLNVYAKTLRENACLPVMVWIHGGGFSTGNCTRNKYGPDYFMSKEMILVTLNYRLSSLGFLSLSDPQLDVPGNAGLKDQILALEWVKTNIRCFGGDPNNVTIFGESAGGASVNYILCANRACGLAQKAICMSGSILNPWAFSERVYDYSTKLSTLKGFTGPYNDREILNFLQGLPAEQLVDVGPLNEIAKADGNLYAFVPTQEPYETSHAVVTKNRLCLLKEAWGNNVPLMLGGVSFEGLVMYPTFKKSPGLLNRFIRNPQNFLPKDIPDENDSDEFSERFNELLQIFFGSYNIESRNVIEYLDFFSYSYFWHGVHRLLAARELYSTAPSFQYYFDFDSPTFNHHRRMFCGTDITKGVAHADDVDYLFHSQHSWQLERNSKEYKIIEWMIDIWFNFAKYSTPNAALSGQQFWKDLVNSNRFCWLHIGRTIRFERMTNDIQVKFQTFNNLYNSELV